jgi:hypothetical protein
MGMIQPQLLLMILLLGFLSCKNSNEDTLQKKKSSFKVSLVRTRELQLKNDTKYPVGKVSGAAISPDSILVLLDAASADVKEYDLNGNFIRKLFARGEGPNLLKAPRSIEVTKDFIFVGDTGFNCTKWFTRTGQLIKQLFLNNYRVIEGDIKMVNSSTIIHGGLLDESSKSIKAILVLDTAGNAMARLGAYPEEYKTYDLSRSNSFDVNSKGSYVISWMQSPAVCIGELKSGEEKLFPNAENRVSYISKNHKPKPYQVTQIEELFKLAREENLNYKVLFLNDSIFVRAYCRPNEKSQKSKSMVLNDNFMSVYTIDNDFLGEFPISGVLHCKFGNELLIEENDEPDNRKFGLYKITIQ